MVKVKRLKALRAPMDRGHVSPVILAVLLAAASVRLLAGESKAELGFFKTTTAQAEKGDAVAQCALGACYESGRGVAPDLGAAVKWYRKSANQGDALAESALGACYEDGRGVAKDFKEAVKWYAKSAAQGCPHGQYNLGNCYANGHGLRADYVEAHKWYSLAAAKDYAPARKALPALERRMTPDRLAEARRSPPAPIPEKKTAP
jgi:TPR repeat protein